MSPPDKPVSIALLLSGKKYREIGERIHAALRLLLPTAQIDRFPLGPPYLPTSHLAGYTLILHKLNDLVALSMSGDKDTDQWLNDARGLPARIWFDRLRHLDALSVFMSRAQFLAHLDRTVLKLSLQQIHIPPWTLVTEDGKVPIPPPYIVKTDLACSARVAHQMRIVRTGDSMGIGPGQLAMRLIPHRALVKVYVIGQNVSIATRPPLPDHLEGIFDSHQLDRGDEPATLSGVSLPSKLLAELHILVADLRHTLDSQLFGLDLLLGPEDPTRGYLVDLNYFPGYREVPDAPELIARLLVDRSIL